MKKITSKIALILVFSFVLVSIQEIRIVKADSTIYIRADGSVNPSTALIQQVGNVYTFTGNIAGNIIVQKDNIIIDGAGYTLQAVVDNDSFAMSLDGRSNVTIENMVITSSGSGLWFNQTSNCGIINDSIVAVRSGVRLRNSNGTTITGNSINATVEYGVALAFSSNNIISENNITTGIIDGVNVAFSSNNTISKNKMTNTNLQNYRIGTGVTLDFGVSSSVFGNSITGYWMSGIKAQSSANTRMSENHITNCGYGILIGNSQNNVSANNISNCSEAGILLSDSGNSVLRNNRMNNNAGNLQVEAYSLSGYINDIDTSNTVNGKPVYYWVNVQDKSVPSDAGYIGLVNCTGITVEGFTFTNEGQGVLLAYTMNSTVTRNNATKNCNIYVDSSSKNTITENNIANNQNGIYLSYSSNNTISANTIANNNNGIYLTGSSSNTITGNSIANNNNGIWLGRSSNNVIYHNNFANNISHVYDIAMEGPFLGPLSVNIWDNGFEGNYWSNYTGQDTNGDGIGDSPHVIYGNNQDNYPLMNPVVIPELPDEENSIPTTESFPTWIVAAIVIIAVVAAALLVYFAKVKKTTGKRSFLVLPLILLTFLNLCFFIGVPPLAVGYENNVVWERDFGRNISDLAVANGKVFTNTHAADLYCLNQQNGETLWKYNFGLLAEGGFLAGLIVADGKVFAGSRGSKLSALDENTGVFLWQFQPNVSSSIASKSPPYFTVMDGKAFTTGDGFYVVNATDGKLIWGYEESYKSDIQFRETQWVVADGRIFIGGIEDAWYLYSLNADTGEILWKYNIFTFLKSSPVVADGRVLVWDRSENQTMLCLNETSGSLLWSYDVGAQAFQPTICDGLVLFGASDGNFYALNETDGTLKWKYETGYQNPKGYFDFAVAKVAYDQVFIGYVDAQLGLGESVFDTHYKYEGYVYSLNLSNGLSNWATNISNTAWGGGSIAIQYILLNLENRTLYATTYADLYSLNVDNGTISSMLHFDYWVLPPIYAYDKLFVAADLKVIAFGETESFPTTWIVAATAIIAIGAAALLVYFRKIKKTTGA